MIAACIYQFQRLPKMILKGLISNKISIQIESSQPIDLYRNIPKLKWSISLKQPNLGWFLKSLPIHFVSIENGKGYLIMKDSSPVNQVLEIIDWDFSELKLSSTIQVLLWLILRGESQQTSQICFNDWYPSQSSKHFNAALRIFGGFSRRESNTLFIKTKDKYYQDSSKIQFSPYFYLPF